MEEVPGTQCCMADNDMVSGLSLGSIRVALFGRSTGICRILLHKLEFCTIIEQIYGRPTGL